MSLKWEVILIAIVLLFVANLIWAIVSEISAQNKIVKFWDERD